MRRLVRATKFVFFLLMCVNVQAAQLINGAGATFPYPLYSKWIAEFQKVDKDTQINYQSIGSGGGVRQFLAKTVDFGASDDPMKDEEMAKADKPVLHIPTILGAVVLTYNLPGLNGQLKLTPELLSSIFLGEIKKWNDTKILAENAGLNLPDKAILVAYRSDGSGTTGVFTDYMSKISETWKTKVGYGKAVKFPTGIGGKGNEGVTGLVKNTPGSIGYVEFVYAEQNKLPIVQIKNKAGKFVTPTAEAITAAAQGVIKNLPADLRVSITNADGATSYPISAFTYLLVYGEMDKQKGEKIVKFMNWALSSGQSFAKSLSYAPLPKEVVAKAKERIKTIQLK